jgi:hypothetical protein
MLLDTREKNIYGFGWGSQWFVRYMGTSCLKRGWDHHVRPWLAYHKMLLDTRSKNIYTCMYGLGVGISTVFDIFVYFLYQGDRIIRYVMTCIPSDAT